MVTIYKVDQEKEALTKLNINQAFIFLLFSAAIGPKIVSEIYQLIAIDRLAVEFWPSQQLPTMEGEG